MISEHQTHFRVRYCEVDAMGYLHHSRYFQYFENGRIEMLRAAGHSYADLEKQGFFFVVVKAECQFKAPARHDEELTLTTRIERQTYVRIDHAYELSRGGTVLAAAKTTIACVGRDGKLREIPSQLAVEGQR
jgi:acyl-CoA thioester hydrolase